MMLGAVFVGRPGVSTRCVALVLACVFILVCVYGWGVYGLLPYGFGSGYEHASPAQRGHMTLASRTGSVAFVLALVSLAVAKRTNRRLNAGLRGDVRTRA